MGYKKGDDKIQTQSTRISGLVPQYVLKGHKDSVTSLCIIGVGEIRYLCSSGHDKRLIVWNLNTKEKYGVLRKPGEYLDEMAADGNIEDMDYSPQIGCIGYSSVDMNIYIRVFNVTNDLSVDGTVDLPLRFVLQGHKAPVTGLKWSERLNVWISGSEDRTVRFWSSTEPVCTRIIENEGPVWSLALDSLNGCILTGGQDCILRVIDAERTGSGSAIIQRHAGHQDGIRSVIHLAFRNQYVTGSWDMTIRVWNAYIKKGFKCITVGQRIITFENSTITEGIKESEENLNNNTRPNNVVTRNRFEMNTDLFNFDDSESTEEGKDDYSRINTEEAANKAKIDQELQAALNNLEKALNTVKEESEPKNRRIIPAHIFRKAITKT